MREKEGEGRRKEEKRERRGRGGSEEQPRVLETNFDPSNHRWQRRTPPPLRRCASLRRASPRLPREYETFRDGSPDYDYLLRMGHGNWHERMTMLRAVMRRAIRRVVAGRGRVPEKIGLYVSYARTF